VESMRTEEEQIEALKKWWQENGNSLLIGIGVALAVVFGWKAYENSAEQAKAEASMMYQQLVTAATSDGFDSQDEASTVSYLASELKSKFDDSEYGLYASLFLAKEAIAGDDLDSAKQELNWALDQTDDLRLQHIIKGRLARVLSAQGAQEEALALLEASDPTFKPNFLEIKGDIYLRMGEKQKAAELYTEAFELTREQPQALPLLGIKLADLGIDPDTL